MWRAESNVSGWGVSARSISNGGILAMSHHNHWSLSKARRWMLLRSERPMISGRSIVIRLWRSLLDFTISALVVDYSHSSSESNYQCLSFLPQKTCILVLP